MSASSTNQSSWADEVDQEDLLTTSTSESKTSNNDNEESKTPSSKESKTPASAPHYKVTVEADKVVVQEVPDIGEANHAPANEVDGATALPINEVEGAATAVDQLATAAKKVC